MPLDGGGRMRYGSVAGMASLNRVDLIGVVASRVHRVSARETAGFVLVTERTGGDGVERHRVLLGARARSEAFQIGDRAYLRGHLECVRGRTVVVAHDAFCVEVAAPPEAAPPPAGTHRSPVAHERRGHLRHVALGTPRERLVWVRASSVRGRGPADE